MARWPLALAGVASLLLHAAVFVWLRPPQPTALAGTGNTAPLQVQLLPVRPPADADVAANAPVPVEPTTAAAGAAAAPAAQATLPANLPAAMPTATGPSAPPAASAASRAEAPLRLLAAPELPGARLAGLTVPVRLWVGGGGRVERLVFGANEAPPDALQALGAALAALRFEPPRGPGQPADNELRLRLCFGDDGLLQASGPGCWDPVVR